MYCITIFLYIAKERSIGFIQLKTVDVFFHVHNLKEFSGIDTTLTFEAEILNVGNAFNTIKGIFTAPVSGIYTFIFLSFKGTNNWETRVSLRVNKIEIAYTGIRTLQELVRSLLW